MRNKELEKGVIMDVAPKKAKSTPVSKVNKTPISTPKTAPKPAKTKVITKREKSLNPPNPAPAINKIPLTPDTTPIATASRPEPITPPKDLPKTVKEKRKVSKQHIKALMKNQNRRRVRSTARVLKHGTLSFFRNAWLAASAVLIMTITLLVVSVTLIANSVLSDTITSIRDQADVMLYLDIETPEEKIEELEVRILRLESVKALKIMSPDEIMEEQLAEMQTDDEAMNDALAGATNSFPWNFFIKVTNIDDTSELDNFLEKDEIVQEYEVDGVSMTETIARLSSMTTMANRIGLIAGIIFVIISMLVIFNTIRMTIFSRQEEIRMMKLIGASKSFIRGPFLVEAILYGLIASIISVALVHFGLQILGDRLLNYGINTAETVAFIEEYWILLVVAVAVAGISIGVIATSFAMKKYLRRT